MEFQHVHLNTFRAHFNKTKARSCILCRSFNNRDDSTDELAELKPPKRLCYSELDVEIVAPDKEVFSVVNYACNVAAYRDPDTMQQMVIATVCLPSGANKVDVTIDPSGAFGLVKIDWSIIMHSVEGNFSNQIKRKHITHYHPKIMALKEQLQNYSSLLNEAPTTIFRKQFPVSVNPANDQVEKEVIMCESTGTLVLFHACKAAANDFAMTKDVTTSTLVSLGLNKNLIHCIFILLCNARVFFGQNKGPIRPVLLLQQMYNTAAPAGMNYSHFLPQ
ncbi:hypothetical protein AC1031_003653 [Aphanomyces cochlioides]|nr:hypothetical protein AC1031_003653 [Aphanomyces cochlioides]